MPSDSIELPVDIFQVRKWATEYRWVWFCIFVNSLLIVIVIFSLLTINFPPVTGLRFGADYKLHFDGVIDGSTYFQIAVFLLASFVGLTPMYFLGKYDKSAIVTGLVTSGALALATPLALVPAIEILIGAPSILAKVAMTPVVLVIYHLSRSLIASVRLLRWEVLPASGMRFYHLVRIARSGLHERGTLADNAFERRYTTKGILYLTALYLGALLSAAAMSVSGPPLSIMIWTLLLGTIDAQLWWPIVMQSVTLLAFAVIFVVSAAASIHLARIAEQYRRLLVKLKQSAASSPVLFLRSFGDDEKSVTPNSPLERLLLRKRRLEEAVGAIASDFGPFVAVGAPGEDLPRLGAHRFYFEDNEWQAAVEKWIRHSAVIVLIAGTTQWVTWELQKIKELGSSGKALIMFPSSTEVEFSKRLRTVCRFFLGGHSQLLAKVSGGELLVFLATPSKILTVYGTRSRQVDLDLAFTYCASVALKGA